MSSLLVVRFESLFDRLITLPGGWHGFHLAVVTLAASLVATSYLWLTHRSSAAESQPTHAPDLQNKLPSWAFATLVLVSLASLTQFHFKADDFANLMHAADHPSEVDGLLRLISVDALFRLGVLLGGSPVFFALCTLAMQFAATFSLYALLRRVDYDHGTALLAAALFGMGPGQIDLLLWASGFQFIAAVALTFVVLRFVDMASRQPESGAAAWVLACALTAAGCFVKYPVIALVPLQSWLWLRWVRTDVAASSRRRIVASLTAAVVAPLILAHPFGAEAGELDKAGAGRIPLNALVGSLDIVGELIRFSLLAALLATVPSTVNSPPPPRRVDQAGAARARR